MGLERNKKGRDAIAGLWHCVAPKWLYNAERVLRSLTPQELRIAEERAEYYCRKSLTTTGTVTARNFRFPRSKPRHTGYFFPLRRLLNYFPQHVSFNYLFGDVYDDVDTPTLMKARPVGSQNATLLPLNAVRHFRFVTADPTRWDDKQPLLVGRNEVHRKARIPFMELWFGHERTNLGQVNTSGGKPEIWLKERLSVDQQLDYKFIACIEGNDVATNLKWVMSSNSLPVMPRPTMETWFMEGKLSPGEHYVSLRDDFSDLLEQMDYYLSHPAEANEIIRNNHEWVERFRNPRLELATALLTLRRYLNI